MPTVMLKVGFILIWTAQRSPRFGTKGGPIVRISLGGWCWAFVSARDQQSTEYTPNLQAQATEACSRLTTRSGALVTR